MTLYVFKNKAPQVHDSAFIAPTAQVIGDVHIRENASIWFHTVIRSDFDKIHIGCRTNIQDLCMCHVDQNVPLSIGNGVTIGHQCIVHGCTIEDNCLIGMGSIVMNKAHIGRNSIVAAGSVVLEGTCIPPFSLAAGAPAKVKKTYDNKAEIEAMVSRISDVYMKNAVDFRSEKGFHALVPLPDHEDEN